MIARLRPTLRPLFAALLVAFSTWGATATAQGSESQGLPFVLKQVGPGVYAAIDGPDHKAGSNSGFVIGDDGVLVVDAFFNVQSAQALITEIRRLTPKPIRYLVNTHYHLDHTGGDQALRDAGAIIIAHRNVRYWLRTDNLNLLGDQITPTLRAQIAELPLPDLVTKDGLTVWLGSRKILVKAMPGHTGGDLTVYIPDANVLFTGDLLWRRIAPNLIDGSVVEWSATDAKFASLRQAARVRFVPGHGELADVRDVQQFHQYLLLLRELVTEGRKAGLSGDALAASVMPKLRAAFPDWSISDRAGSAEVRFMAEELAGTKHRPIAQPD